MFEYEMCVIALSMWASTEGIFDFFFLLNVYWYEKGNNKICCSLLEKQILLYLIIDVHFLAVLFVD